MPERACYYITTAIPYANGAPHIGHAYERIATDSFARFNRLDGRDVLFVTGMDEHGLKMQQTATRDGLTPQALADRTAEQFMAMGEKLNAVADDVVRTTQTAPQGDGAGNLAAHGRAGRHLPVQICGLVLGARRGLLRRRRTDRKRGRPQVRAHRHAGRMGRGGELFLPPLGLCRPAAGPLRGQSGFRHAGKVPQRDRGLRQARAEGPVDQPHDLRLGHSGAGRRAARDVCLGRRADQLPDGDRAISRAASGRSSGPATPMSSARTSPASTPSSGRPS